MTQVGYFYTDIQSKYTLAIFKMYKISIYLFAIQCLLYESLKYIEQFMKKIKNKFKKTLSSRKEIHD